MNTKFNIIKIYKYKNKELLQLINKFYKIDNKIIDLLNSYSNDSDIIYYIKDNLNINNDQLNYSNTIASKKRALNIIKYLKYSNHKYIKINNYLDIGCNNGSKTIEIGKLLHLNSNNIYGIDVESFSGVKIIPISGFYFYTYDNIKKKILPFKNNSFEFITVIQVLHHIKKPFNILKEIIRVLKPNGLLFIREHDRLDKYDDKLIRLEHLLYAILVDNIDYETYIKIKYEKYFSREKLINKLKELGFNLLEQKTNLYNKSINPTKYYNMILQLTNK